MKKIQWIIITAAFLPLVLVADPVIYLNEKFDNGNRKVQNLPNSAQWFASHTQTRAAQVIEKDGNYVLAINDYTPTAVRGAIAYFTKERTAVTLTPEKNILRFSFDFTANAETVGDMDRGVRFIVANTERGRLYKDELGNLRFRGYMVAMNPGTGRLHFRTRNDASSNYLSSVGPWDNQPVRKSVMGMQGGVTYNMTIEIERLPNDHVQITATMTGGGSTASASWVDSSYLCYDFNTVGVGATGRTITGRMDFDNILVMQP